MTVIDSPLKIYEGDDWLFKAYVSTLLCTIFHIET